MDFDREYTELSAIERQKHVNRMRVEVSDLQVALDELNVVTPKVILSQYSHSLIPAPANLGLRIQRTTRVSKSKVLVMETFGGSGSGAAEPGFVTLSQDGAAVLWDAATALKFEAIRVGKGSMMAVTVNSSCTIAAAGGLNCAVDLYSVGSQLRTLTGDTPEPVAFPMSYYPSQTRNTHPEQFRLTLSGHDAAVTNLDFLSDTMLVSASQDGGVYSWDLSTGSPISYSMESDSITALSRSTEHVFCTATSDGRLKIWDLRAKASESPWFGLPYSVMGAKFMPEGGSVLLSNDSGLDMFDLRTGTSLEQYALGRVGVTTFDVSPSGRFAFVGTENGITAPLDLLQNRVLEPLDTRRDRLSSVRIIGSSVYAANWDGTVRSFAAVQKPKK